ncbi:SUMF1/EgtB/PvdO family nonheme iron enzyme [Caballeronia sp. NK8]|uniref:formylglycine-generating enzyme family protein n=1 Tax=Caballeronia sp. NK8 TaxID=140098 RepID=UPI001BB6572E|nr:formylglycine-generating enzyme family protein [Caballeronia sp. NK8]BCQ25906.1 SUMF1/EgtB/PvdO family nonheme iron enzyme [Caballeronia sp. NK8]
MFKRYRMRLLIGLGFASLTAVPVYAKTVPPATTFKDCDYCSEMVVLPAGEYMMGATKEDFGDDSRAYQLERLVQGEPHSVHVNSFAIGRFHVTRKQFGVFARETGFKGKGCMTFKRVDWDLVADADWQNPGFPQTDDDPVVCVSWTDVKQYIEWLNSKLAGKTTHRYRLPTEEEWEYAARAGTTTPMYWGTSRREQCRYENTRDETAKALGPDVPVAPCDDHFLWTSPVGSFQPNQWSLYDMLGNATQWMLECSENGGRLTANLSPVPEVRCRGHKQRGGSWASIPTGIRAASWGGNYSNTRDSTQGFRLAAER